MGGMSLAQAPGGGAPRKSSPDAKTRPEPRGKAPEAKAPSPPEANAAPQGLQVPPPELLAGLIRWTLTAVSQANATGNYTVLRDLGSPEFQAANSTAKLSDVFSGLRQKRVSLAFVAISTPQLSQAPTIDAKGTLRVIGAYPNQAVHLTFDLTFQLVGGAWRHAGIALSAVPAQ